MRVGVEASEAYRHTGHLGSVVASVGSTWLVVVLESCHSQHGAQVSGHLRQQAALRGHRRAMQHHRRRRLHFHCQRALVRSDKPGEECKHQVRDWEQGDAYLNEILAFGFCNKRLQFGGGEGVDKTCL
jgi:hypothetical protein